MSMVAPVEDTGLDERLLEQLDFDLPCRALPPEVEQCPESAEWGGWCTACGSLAVTLCFQHATWLRGAQVRSQPMKHMDCGAVGTVGDLMKIAPLPRASR